MSICRARRWPWPVAPSLTRLGVLPTLVLAAIAVTVSQCLADSQDRPGVVVAPQAASDELYVARVLTTPKGFTSGIEGPAVDADGLLYAVNYARQHTIGVVTPEGEASLFVELPEGSTGNGIRFDRAGRMLIADYKGHNILRMDMLTRSVVVFAHEAEMNQPNDLAIGADDALYASDPNWHHSTGQIWRIGATGTVQLLEADMGTTNGIEISPDERHLYVGESVQRRVWVYDLQLGGQDDEAGDLPLESMGVSPISNKRLLIEFDTGGMDGMRCDVLGNLYVTRHGLGLIAKVSPDGRLLREIALTGKQPSNIAFGGVDGRTAYVTLQDKGNIETFRVDAPGRAWQLQQREK